MDHISEDGVLSLFPIYIEFFYFFFSFRLSIMHRRRLRYLASARARRIATVKSAAMNYRLRGRRCRTTRNADDMMATSCCSALQGDGEKKKE